MDTVLYWFGENQNCVIRNFHGPAGMDVGFSHGLTAAFV